MNRFASSLLILTAIAHAAVDGTVINRTTGKPQPNATVTLYSLGGSGGMKPLKTVNSDAQGAFRIDAEVSGPHLLQTIHAAVLYNEVLTPGAKTSGLELGVYDSAPKVDSAKVTQHMVILEPLGNMLHVNETVMFQNTGNITYNDPSNGTLRVFVPEGIKGDPRMTVTAPQGMPIERNPAKTTTPNVYKIDYPVKPGETRFDLSYVMPLPAPPVFSSRILHTGGHVRLVAPQGVTLTSDTITMLGQEPKTQAKVYEVKAKEYSVQIEGSGQLGPPESEESSSNGRGGRGIQTIEARIYDQVFVVLGLAVLILTLASILLYRRGSGPKASPSQPEAKRR